MSTTVTLEQILQQKARVAEAEAAYVQIVKDGNIIMGSTRIVKNARGCGTCCEGSR
jgi:hypothetical protein